MGYTTTMISRGAHHQSLESLEPLLDCSLAVRGQNVGDHVAQDEQWIADGTLSPAQVRNQGDGWRGMRNERETTKTAWQIGKRVVQALYPVR